jgi:hypothetical protein
MLLRRVRLPVAEAVERLVGQQAQIPVDPYIGLWSRLAGFRPEELGRMVESGKAVRLSLLRATLHLVTARDARGLRPLVQPVLDRSLHAGGPYRGLLGGLDRPALVDAGARALAGGPLTQAALGERLRERWPGRDAASLAFAVRALLPMVQAPPRGVWGRAGRPTWALFATSPGAQRAGTVESLVLRYLAAFGPATPADVQAWSGLTRLREVLEGLRRRLRVVRDEDGRELFDVPDAPWPHPDTPAPVRFLPAYDNVVLGHADRDRIVSRSDRRSFPPTNEAFAPFLVDGFVRGLWKVERTKRGAMVRTRIARRLTRAEAAAVTEEALSLLGFLAADAESHDVRLEPEGQEPKASS